MVEERRQLKGSWTRDEFKKWHKDALPRNFWACDIDFALIEKQPLPRIIAILDYKRQWDDVRFSEAIAYNHLVKRGIPVFIVVGEPPFDSLSVYKYITGDWIPEPPKIERELILENATPEQFQDWEQQLRSKFRTWAAQHMAHP